MSVIVWNCRGLGNPGAVQYLQEMRREKKPDMIFLSETFYRKGRMDRVRRTLGYASCFEVEARGHSGGLALLWDAEIDVTLQSYSRNHIDVVVEEGEGKRWRFTGVYGVPRRYQQRETWNLLRTLAAQSSLPWCLAGDFNCITAGREKRGGARYPAANIHAFCEVLSEIRVHDMGYKGSLFTWCRGEVLERLDRGVATQDWFTMFPFYEVKVLAPGTSDHSPLLIKRRSQTNHYPKQKTFKFEDVWMTKETCREIINSTWQGTGVETDMNGVMQVLDRCGENLQRWGRAEFGGMEKKLRECQEKFEALRNLPVSDIEAEREQERVMAELLVQKEIWWKQRSRANWLKEGDRNTKFFHSRATQRKKKNTLEGIEGESGNWCTGRKEMEGVIRRYYQKLFSSNNNTDFDRVLNVVRPRITSADNQQLDRPFSREEIRGALFQMYPTKAPGPDGMTARFFQNYWDIVGQSVIVACLKFLNEDSQIPEKLNETNVCLIPKCKNPKRMTELRPISLCNVLYKIISKALANRLKLVLDRIISPSQSAFVPGRLISDNLLVASEALHYLKLKTRGVKGWMAVKLDVSKAYDRMEWRFLDKMMDRMGFSQRWRGLVMQCVTSVSYRFLLNGKPTPAIKPSRGLRQGDPISPYLFILCSEALSELLREAEEKKRITGLKVCRGAPPISHLLFADDSFSFCQAHVREAHTLKAILNEYESASGQAINYSKSAISFSKNVTEERKAQIAQIMGISTVDHHDFYLGLPADLGKYKSNKLEFVKERMQKRIDGWKEALLSRGGKEVLIKSVAGAIPTYAMSVMRLSDDLCDKIEKIQNAYWWKDSNTKQGIHWMRWERMAVPKARGGLGFRSMKEFNTAMLAKQGWRLLQEKPSLAYNLLKSKYFPRCNFMEASIGPNGRPSPTWRSIMSAQELLRSGCRKIVGEGGTIDIWGDQWLPNEPYKVTTPKPSGCEVNKVSELIDWNYRNWKLDLLGELFNEDEIFQIMSIPIRGRWRRDSWAWKHNSKGTYTVKSGYHTAMAEHLIPENSPSDEELWKLLWKIEAPEKVRILMWRICNNILPVANRLSTKGVAINTTCAVCLQQEESTFHCIFDCSVAREVWKTCPLNIEVEHWPTLSVKDNVLLVLHSYPPEFHGLFAMLCWGIWGARNNKIWNNKGLTPTSIVHQSTRSFSEFREARKGLTQPLTQNQRLNTA